MRTKVTGICVLLVLLAITSPLSLNAQFDIARESCFSIARSWVIEQEGEINLDNVGFVNDLTAYLRSTGTCD